MNRLKLDSGFNCFTDATFWIGFVGRWIAAMTTLPAFRLWASYGFQSIGIRLANKKSTWSIPVISSICFYTRAYKILHCYLSTTINHCVGICLAALKKRSFEWDAKIWSSCWIEMVSTTPRQSWRRECKWGSDESSWSECVEESHWITDRSDFILFRLGKQRLVHASTNAHKSLQVQCLKCIFFEHQSLLLQC